MSKTTATASLSSTATCGLAGLMLGQIVLALAVHHERTVEGLGFALVFLLAGGASVACALAHRHQQRHPRGARAPMGTWLVALAAGVLASLQFAGGF